jgi:hypothetical protein
MASVVKGEQVRLLDMGKGSIGTLPILITADWCPFTLTAENFWTKAAQSVGLTLRVLNAESDEGKRIMSTVNVTGVPCLIAAPERLFYGMNINFDEATSFLNTP